MGQGLCGHISAPCFALRQPFSLFPLSFPQCSKGYVAILHWLLGSNPRMNPPTHLRLVP